MELVVLLLVTQLHSVLPEFSVTDYYTFYSGHLGYGRILGEQFHPSIMSCGISCSLEAQCTAANYHHGNGTCLLMEAIDAANDHVEADGNEDVAYTCSGCEDGLAIPIGSWPFIDELPASPGVTAANISFAPAFPGSDFSVLSLEGHYDSYVSLENTGNLVVSSFTWSADIFPYSQTDGPLFNWICASPATCPAMGTHIWYTSGKLYIKLENHGGGVACQTNKALAVNQWNKVAVAYDASSQLLQMYVNGDIEEFPTTSLSAPHSTYGRVALGAWYHWSYYFDQRAFNGSMACVKLWNFFRELTTYRADTLACQYM